MACKFDVFVVILITEVNKWYRLLNFSIANHSITKSRLNSYNNYPIFNLVVFFSGETDMPELHTLCDLALISLSPIPKLEDGY